MANTLGIQEVTLVQLKDSTHAINTIDLTGTVDESPRKSVWQPIVCRVTDHDDNDTGEVGTDTDKMALFSCAKHGDPWKKDQGLKHIISAGGDAATSEDTIIFVDHDYSTFE